MLYALVSFSDQIEPLNVFRYITFRVGGAIMTALLFVFLFGPAIIDLLRVKQGKGQPIRAGGLMILSGVTVSTLLWANWWNTYVWTVLAALWMMGSSSAMDAIGKLDGQIVIPAIVTAVAIGLIAYLSGSGLAHYLQIPHVPGIGELTVVCGAIIGAGCGCLLRESDGCSTRW
jgi:phospho-N-acetylmuramoyl-pentapeptide-transferase